MSRDWSEIDNKLLDASWHTGRDYLDVYKTLRDEDPVHWAQDDHFGRGYWFVSRHDDVKHLISNPPQITSRLGSKIPVRSRRYTPEERYSLNFDTTITFVDNPVHLMMRRPINKHFSVPSIARLASRIEGHIDDIIADVAAKGDFDFVLDVAAELPLRVVLTLLDVPKEDWEEVKHATHLWGTPFDPRYMIDGDPLKTQYEGRRRLNEYAQELTTRRRANPGDDLVTAITKLEFDGDPLSDKEVVTWIISLIGGGLETTRNAASVGIDLFGKNPDQRQLLMDDPSLSNVAVEEMVRWISPQKVLLRSAAEDFELGGKEIRLGDWILAGVLSANRDERVFDNPDSFDILRTPNPHVGFGDGTHLCLGRALIRLELGMLFPKLFRTFPDLEYTGDGALKWIPDYNSVGLYEYKMTTGKVPALAR